MKLKEMGKNALIRHVKAYHALVERMRAYILRVSAELVKLDPANGVFTNDEISPETMREILAVAGMKEEEWIEKVKAAEKDADEMSDEELDQAAEES